MKKRGTLLTALLLALTVMVSVLPCAAAKEINPDTDRGTIELTLKAKDMEATLYRVGTGRVQDSNLVFDLQDELKREVGDLELNGLKAKDVEKVVKALTDKSVKLKEILDEDEIWVVTADEKTKDGYLATLEDMPMGVYLVVQTKNRSDFEDFDPFLLYLPESIDGGWNASVTANPKAEEVDYDDPEYPVNPPEEIPDNPPPKDPGDPPDDDEPYEEFPEEEVPLATLPQTGLLQWPVPVMAMAGLLLFAVGFASEKRRKSQMN